MGGQVVIVCIPRELASRLSVYAGNKPLDKLVVEALEQWLRARERNLLTLDFSYRKQDPGGNKLPKYVVKRPR